MGHPCIVITQNIIDLSLAVKSFKSFNDARMYVSSLTGTSIFSKSTVINNVKALNNQLRYNYVCGHFDDANNFTTLLNAVIIEDRNL